jgi:hypothetical protein
MEAGLQSGAFSRPERRLAGPALVVLAVVLLLARARPLWSAYLDKLRAGHPAGVVAGAAIAALFLGVLLAMGLRFRPAAVGLGLAAFAAATLILSGNAAAGCAAILVVSATLSIGDLVVRALRRGSGGRDDLSSTFAAGFVAVGLAVLGLAEAGWLSAVSLAAVLAAGALALPRRLPDLARRCARAVRVPRGSAPPGLESAWLAFVLLVIAAAWMGALCPEVSWDGLAYHLPEARAIAQTGRILPARDLAPQSYLWRAHESFLSLGFFYGGERVARLLQLAVGLFAFGATVALARRIGGGGSGPLAALLLAAFPTAMLQLHAAYVDWPAAFLVTAAAAELAAGFEEEGRGGRLRVAGFLFGGAVAAKIFAFLAAPALLVLALRRREGRPRALAAFVLAGALALVPWMLWSVRHGGTVAAPFGSSVFDAAGRLQRGEFFTRSPASGAASPAAVPWSTRAVRFVRLPYDLVFHSSRFEANGDGYNGVLVLAAAAGLAGWSARRLAVFSAVALAALLPWSQLYLPSVRFLFPLFPLYAVFVAEGLERLTQASAGGWGRAAGVALLAAAAAFPVQAGSSGLEARVAFGRLSREAYLDEVLPAHPLWGRVRAADRVLFLGENDRFHSPAAEDWRDDFAPAAGWGADPDAWRRGLDELGITAILVREDRRPGAPASLEALGLPLVPVARRGPALLLRVRR